MYSFRIKNRIIFNKLATSNFTHHTNEKYSVNAHS